MTADRKRLAAVALIGRHEPNATVAVLGVVPVHERHYPGADFCLTAEWASGSSDSCRLCLEVLANANLPDIGDDISIDNNERACTSISTSTGLDCRCLNNNRSWMFGINVGHERRPMATGTAVTGMTANNS